MVSSLGRTLPDVAAEDIVEMDLEGTVLKSARPPLDECMIHTAIFARRPDVWNAVHFHSFFAGVLAIGGSPSRRSPAAGVCS